MNRLRLFRTVLIALMFVGQAYAQNQQQTATPEASLVLKPGAKFSIIYSFHQPTEATNGGCVFELLTPRHPNQSQFAAGFNRTNWTKTSPKEVECEFVVPDAQASGTYQLTRVYVDLARGPEFSYVFGKDFQADIKINIRNDATDADRPKLDDVRLVRPR